jgi:hypothetical protein
VIFSRKMKEKTKLRINAGKIIRVFMGLLI